MPKAKQTHTTQHTNRSIAAGGDADPVLALISAHRVAVADWYTVTKELWQLAPKLPIGRAGVIPSEELLTRLQDAGEAEQRALHDVLDCRPATL
jgi:hypothetical protein